MFELILHDPADLADLDDHALVSAVQDGARAVAAAQARTLAAVAELTARRCTDELHPDWTCDDWDAAAAEIGCALNLGHGRAMGQMDLGLALRDRFPKVGAQLLAGQISERTAATIVDRTGLVVDEAALADLDAALADRAAAWGPLSQYKLEQHVDAKVCDIDPDAVHRTRNRVRGRSFTVGSPHDTAGTTSVFGRLTTTDAALLDARLTAMAKGVCPDDPRTLAQRRADAVGALAAHSTVLQCRCGDPTCPAAAQDDGRASSVTVTVVAEAATLDEPADPLLDGEGLAPPAGTPAEAPPAEAPAAAPTEPSPDPRRKAGLIPGRPGGAVPAAQVADLIAHGATVRPVPTPTGNAEPHYRPSTPLDRFVRTRDLTCRWPGCDRPAFGADIDHTKPWPAGATHPANTKCYCRLHHLVKTFWPGFTDHQDADGSVRISTPSGHTYVTKPFASLLFPDWRTTTSPAPDAPATPAPTGTRRERMMPTRRRTRAQNRAARIKAERKQNNIENGGDEDPF